MSLFSLIFSPIPHPPIGSPTLQIDVWSDHGCPTSMDSKTARDWLLSEERARASISHVFIKNYWRSNKDDAIHGRNSRYTDDLGNEWAYMQIRGYETWETEVYRYQYQKGSNHLLSPLLTASIIEEAQTGPSDTIFERAVRKTDDIMKERQLAKKDGFGWVDQWPKDQGK